MESEVLLPGILLPSLHGVSHSETGAAEGTTEKRLQLGDRGDDCVIHFGKASWDAAGPCGMQCVQGVRVKLRLKGKALLARFGGSETTALVDDVIRLVTFRAPDVALVHQETASQLEGFYLPVPPEWVGMGKPMTAAKIIALLSRVTSIPLEELRAMHDEQSHPSDSTRKRLNKDVPEAAACLRLVPVSSLLSPEVYATPATGTTLPLDVRIDPLIAAAYGPNSSSL